MKNTYRNYTPEEIFAILQEEHLLVSFVDPEVEGNGWEIKRDTTIYEWRISMDFLPWKQLHKANNEKFKINVSYSDWRNAILPEKKKTVWDLCVFVSQHAKKEVICPTKLLGRESLSAAVFLTLKKNLSQRGIDVKDLRPSTALNSFISRQNFPRVLTEIILMGVRTFDSLESRLRKDISFWQRFKFSNLYYIDTGAIKTFGDLAKKIAMGLSDEKMGQESFS
ncbi:MAG: hypothetical protein ABSF37_08545 [Sedimentisphaerales bacterium]|jgi:hypothetical protein